MGNKTSGLLAGVAAAAALLLSGCGTDAATPTTSTATTTITSSSADSAAPTSTSASASAPSSTVTATSTVAPPPSSPPPAATVTSTATATSTTTATAPPSSPDTEEVDPAHCLSSNLSVTLGPGDGTAGSVYYNLVFTNTGSAACTLDGHPGVSFVGGDDGHQIGLSAEMDDSVPNTLVTIEPGNAASATLRVSEAGNYDAAQCQPEKARGLRVYPPDETASVFVEQDFDACASESQNLLTIGSVA